MDTATRPQDADEAIEIVETHPDDPSAYWKCPRCGHAVSIPLTAAADQDLVDAQLTAKRQEHEDYHFARDLHTEERGTGASRPAPTNGPSDRSAKVRKPIKKAKPPEGIRAFFNAKPKDGS